MPSKRRTRLTPHSSLLYCFLIAVLILATHWFSLNNPPVFDAFPHLKLKSYQSIIEGFSILRVRWLSSLSFYIIDRISPDDFFWQHLANVIVHIINTILVYFFTRKIWNDFSENKSMQASHEKWALFCALLFGLNPVSVYAVDYHIQRSILLATGLSLASLLCLIHSFARKTMRRKNLLLISSLAFYFLAISAKEHAVALPGVCFLLAIAYRQIKKENAVRLGLAFLIYTLIALYTIAMKQNVLGQIYEPQAEAYTTTNHFSDVATQIPEPTLTIQNGLAYPLSILNQATLFFRYLGSWFFPNVNFMSIDLHPAFPTQIFSWALVGGIFFVIYLAFGVFFLTRKDSLKILGLGFLYPAVLFATEFSTVRFSESFVLYRSYLWMSGVFLIIPFLFRKLPTLARRIGFAITLALLIVLLQNRLQTFGSQLTVWKDAVEKLPVGHENNPGSYRPYYSMGFFLILNGQYEEAISYLQKAIMIMPQDYAPYYNLGLALDRLNRKDDALDYYRKALERDPHQTDISNNIGAILIQKGEYNEAKTYLENALQHNPGSVKVHNNLGALYDEIGNIDKALNEFETALKLDANFIDARYNLAAVLRKKGEPQKALLTLNELLKQFPNHLKAHLLSGYICYELKDYPNAAKHFESVTRLNPNHANAYLNWGNTLVRQGLYAQALLPYQRALQIEPQNAQLYFNMGSILLELHDQEKSDLFLNKALALDGTLADTVKKLKEMKSNQSGLSSKHQ